MTPSIAVVTDRADKVSGLSRSLLVSSASAVRSASAAVEVVTAVEVTPATITVAAVEVSATVTAIEAAAVAATTVTTISAAAVVSTATVAISAAVVAMSVTMKPRSGADEDTACEPVRGVVAVGSAGVRIVIVVAIGANGRGAVIGGAYAHADRPSLRVRVRSAEQTDSKTNAE